MTLSNVNGVPCLELRIGNADGSAMRLTDVAVRLTFGYSLEYQDEFTGRPQKLWTTKELDLLQSRRHNLEGVWTVRHFLDETSPLLGVLGVPDLEKSIYEFRVAITAVQETSKTNVAASTGYQLQDILVGHKFVDQIQFDTKTGTLTVDYAKMNAITPGPVWYPTQTKEGPATGEARC